MSPFTWFAVILTVAYIIYYTVMIMNDLYGKKPEEHNSTEEIDVPTTTDDAALEEAPIAVSESDEGFSVGEEEYEANLIPDDGPIEEETVQTNEKVEEEKPLPAENLRNVVEEYGEEIESAFDDRYGSLDFRNALLSEVESNSDRTPIVKEEIRI